MVVILIKLSFLLYRMWCVFIENKIINFMLLETTDQLRQLSPFKSRSNSSCDVQISNVKGLFIEVCFDIFIAIEFGFL